MSKPFGRAMLYPEHSCSFGEMLRNGFSLGHPTPHQYHSKQYSSQIRHVLLCDAILKGRAAVGAVADVAVFP